MKIMTPEEKAKDLVENFYDATDDFPVQCGQYCQGGYIDKKGLAKQCALMTVDEILASRPFYPHPEGYYELMSDRMDEAEKFWEEVKEEILKL